MKKYVFRDCTLAVLEEEFGIREVFTLDALNQWLETDVSLAEVEETILNSYQELLIVHEKAWNEQELSQQFIGPIFGLARFTELYRFRFFAERKIEAKVPGLVEEISLSGEPDGFIATGYREPKVPMFAFTEYKKALDPNGDPAGQTLAAMLVGQTLNKHEHPLYGAYVVGSEWRFIVLEGKQYIVSRGYSALADELFDIFRFLKALKQIVLVLTEK